MSTLEWPPSARLTAEARRAIQAEHDQQERARAAQRRHHQPPHLPAPPPAVSPADLAALTKRVAALERFNREILPDAIGKALAELHHTIDKAQSAESIRTKVGAALAEMYCGVWDVSRKFTQGALVTSDGSLWLSLVESKGLRPGSSNGAWRLVAKGYTAAARKKETPK